MSTSNITETFSVRLPDDLKTEVDRLAASTRRSRSFIIKEAVIAYMCERMETVTDAREVIRPEKLRLWERESRLIDEGKGTRFKNMAELRQWIAAL